MIVAISPLSANLRRGSMRMDRVMPVRLFSYRACLRERVVRLADLSRQVGAALRDLLRRAGRRDASRPEGSPPPRASLWLPVGVALVGIAISGLLWQRILSSQHTQIERAVQARVITFRNALQSRIESRVLVIERTGRRWALLGRPSRRGWVEDTTRVSDHFPGIQAIAWADPEMRVQWVAPERGNAPLVSLDLSTDAVARQTLEAARERHRLTLSPVIQLPHERPGFLGVMPIYLIDLTIPADAEVPRPFDGYIVGYFLVDSLLDAIIDEMETEEEALGVFSFAVLADGREIHTRVRAGREYLRHPFRKEATLELSGLKWILQAWPSPEYYDRVRTRLPEIALVVGVLGSVLLAYATHLARVSQLQAWQVDQANIILQQQIAERQRAEADVQRQHNFLNALVENLREGIIACDEQGKLTLANPTMLAWQGLDGHAAVRSSGDARPQLTMEQVQRNLYRPDGRSVVGLEQSPLARAVREELLAGEELAMITPDGCRRRLLASGQAIHDRTGRKLGAVVVFHDITALKQAEEELREFADRLQRSNRELQDFASVASHDLQEPLRKIQAFGDRLKVRCGKELTPEGADYLDRIQNAAARMQALIEDLLAFSRVTTKARPFEPTDLGRVAQGVLADLEARIEQLQATVQVGQMPIIDADPLQMRQLLQNLIGNGLKFHRPGQKPQVRVEAKIIDEEFSAEDDSGQQWCEIRVRDEGIGFDVRYLDRIFTVFQRLHGRNEYPGTGIGLAICRKIVERHGGTITAHSAPGQGAEFIVRLPVRQESAGKPR